MISRAVFLSLLSSICICLADDLSFTDGEDNVTICMGKGGDVLCTSETGKSVKWWHEGMKVELFPSFSNVYQTIPQRGLCRIYFTQYVTVEYSGEYLCKSLHEEKILRVTIYDPSQTTFSYESSSTTTETTSHSTNDGDDTTRHADPSQTTFSYESSSRTTATTSLSTHGDDATRQAVTIVVLSALLVIMVTVLVTVLLCRSRRNNDEEMKKSTNERGVSNYDFAEDFKTFPHSSNAAVNTKDLMPPPHHEIALGGLPQDNNERDVLYSVIDNTPPSAGTSNIATSKSGNYQTLNLSQRSTPAVDGLYDRLHRPIENDRTSETISA